MSENWDKDPKNPRRHIATMVTHHVVGRCALLAWFPKESHPEACAQQVLRVAREDGAQLLYLADLVKKDGGRDVQVKLPEQSSAIEITESGGIRAQLFIGGDVAELTAMERTRNALEEELAAVERRIMELKSYEDSRRTDALIDIIAEEKGISYDYDKRRAFKGELEGKILKKLMSDSSYRRHTLGVRSKKA